MVQLKDKRKIKRNERIFKKKIRKTTKMKRKIFKIKFERPKKKILRMQCFMKEENG